MEELFDYTNDAILPDGFDPNDQNFTLDSLGSETVEESAPTTEQTSQPTPEQPEVQQTQEPTITPTQSTEATQLTQSTQLTQQPAPQTIKVKFNHEERELSFDEAAQYAQKGMNYDKLEAKIAGYEASAQRYGALAKRLGYESQDEMIAAAEQNFVNRRIKELKAEGNTDAMAKFLVEQEMAKAATPTVQAPQPQGMPNSGQKPSTAMSPEREAELKEFVKAYPGITKLPEEVITANRQGVRLILAYERHLNKQAQAEAQKTNQAQQQEIAILKQNQASAAKAPVTGATGKAGGLEEGPIDPFLKGFDSAY